MASLNRIQIMGHIGRDPESKFTPAGKHVISFSVATTVKWNDRESGEKKEDTVWHNVECWDKQADFVGEHCFKGQLVFVEGQMRHDQYEKDGVTKYYAKIRCRDIQPLQWRDRDDTNKPVTKPDNKGSSDVTLDDDIPF